MKVAAHDYAKSVTYINEFINSLLPSVKISHDCNKSKHSFFVIFQGNTFNFEFSTRILSDFENLRNRPNAIDRNRAEEHIRFSIYIPIGAQGLIPHINISEELLSDKGLWFERDEISLESDIGHSGIYYKGLKIFYNFLGHLCEKFKDCELPEINEEKTCIEKLIAYYDSNKAFTHLYVTNKDLCLLKAAAICYIINKERDKKTITPRSVLKDIDKTIYQVVGTLLADPFPNIRILDSLHDYYDYVKEVEKK